MRPKHGGCWLALGLAVVAPAMWALPAGAETTLAVDAGYAGSFVPGREVPVRVRVTADRLVRGTLEVGVGTPWSTVPVVMAVEVPGGSQKEFLVTVPTGTSPNPNVSAHLRQDDRVVASAQAGLQSTSDVELVGVLPGALRGRGVPGPAPLAVDAGTARFVIVGDADLAQAPSSLGPLSTVAAAADEIGRLSPDARSGLLRWVDSGGRLLVDTPRGQPVAGLPDGWQPGGRGRIAAGIGEVVVADGAIAAGRWSGLIEPSGWATFSAQFDGGFTLASSLAADAGLRTPELGWLVGFLALYVAVVGPALFLALRRLGRPELAWVAVPLVAVVFSAGSYTVGRNLRNDTRLVHASVLATGPSGPVAMTHVGVFSSRGETARIGFPQGWASGWFSGATQPSAPSEIRLTPAGPETRLPLDAGQFGVVHAAGPVAAGSGGGFEITAATEPGGRVTGTVRNPSPFRLDDVAVFVGPNAVLVGTLDPGQQRPFAVAGLGEARFDGAGPEFQVWTALQVGDRTAPADLGLWQAAQRMGGINYLSPGAVVAAGWTREFVPEVRVGDGVGRPVGRTVVVGRLLIDPPARGTTGVAARRDIVRDPFSSRMAMMARPAGAVVRFVLPTGVDTAKLVLKGTSAPAELWQDGAWRAATCAGAGCGAAPLCPPGAPSCVLLPPDAIKGLFGAGAGAAGAELTVPPAAVRDGVIYVRVQGPVSMDQGGSMTIARSA